MFIKILGATIIRCMQKTNNIKIQSTAKSANYAISGSEQGFTDSLIQVHVGDLEKTVLD